MTPAPATGRTADENEMRAGIVAALNAAFRGFSFPGGRWSEGYGSEMAADALLSGTLAPILQEAATLRARLQEAERALEALGRDPDGSGSRPSDQAASHPAPAGFDPSRTALRALRIGDMVRVRQHLDKPWTFDWQDGPYEVVGLALDRHGEPNVTLSHDGDVGADGFSPEDLERVAPCDGSGEADETAGLSPKGDSAVTEGQAPNLAAKAAPLPDSDTGGRPR